MRKQRPGAAAGDLNDRVHHRVSQLQATPQGADEGHSRIEVSATHGAQQRDQGRKHGYGRSRVREERNA
jgi:hypothetical protein